MAHGYSKLVRGPEHFAEILHALGIPIPGFTGWLTIVVELVGGLAVLLGAFVPWLSIALGQHSIGGNLTCVCIYAAAALQFLIDKAPGSHLNRGSIGHGRVRG